MSEAQAALVAALKSEFDISARKVASLSAKLFTSKMAPHFTGSVKERLRGIFLEGSQEDVIALAEASLTHEELRVRLADALQKLPVQR